MSVIKSKHLISKNLIIILLLLLANCQLQESKNLHGINYLENRKNILTVNKSNKNDVLKLLGNPHSKSINNENSLRTDDEKIVQNEEPILLSNEKNKNENTLEKNLDSIESVSFIAKPAKKSSSKAKKVAD